MTTVWAAIRKVIGDWPRTAQEFYDRAFDYSTEGLHGAAIEDLNEAIRRLAAKSDTPEDREAHEFLSARACEYMELKEFDKARADLEEAVSKYGYNFGALMEIRAICQFELGNFERALELYQQQGDPSELGQEANLGRARCLERLDRIEEARAAFDLAVDKPGEGDEVDSETYFDRGKFRLEYGEPRAALEDLDKALWRYDDGDADFNPPLDSWVIEAFRLRSEAQRAAGKDKQADEDARQADLAEQAQRDYRPRSVGQIQTASRLAAALSLCAASIIFAIVLWIAVPVVYFVVAAITGLPPLGAWWKFVPMTMIGIAVVSIVLLTSAYRKNAKRDRE